MGGGGGGGQLPPPPPLSYTAWNANWVEILDHEQVTQCQNTMCETEQLYLFFSAYVYVYFFLQTLYIHTAHVSASSNSQLLLTCLQALVMKHLHHQCLALELEDQLSTLAEPVEAKSPGRKYMLGKC